MTPPRLGAFGGWRLAKKMLNALVRAMIEGKIVVVAHIAFYEFKIHLELTFSHPQNLLSQ